MNQQRNITLDILRIVMAFMVIGSHGGFLREFGQFARYIYVSGIVRIAVPIFLNTNGCFPGKFY
jgi:peptidoglycan/LPS O-acetylase OafA/YrhL